MVCNVITSDTIVVLGYIYRSNCARQLNVGRQVSSVHRKHLAESCRYLGRCAKLPMTVAADVMLLVSLGEGTPQDPTQVPRASNVRI